jgi:hypothetical protein
MLADRGRRERVFGVRKQLDSVAVRIGDLDPREAVTVFPFHLYDSRLPQALAGSANLVEICELKAEVVAGRLLRLNLPLLQREHGAVVRTQGSADARRRGSAR